jgi:hypothetical protein
MHVLISSKIASSSSRELAASGAEGRKRRWHSEWHCGRVGCSRRRLRGSGLLLYCPSLPSIRGLGCGRAGSQAQGGPDDAQLGGGLILAAWSACGTEAVGEPPGGSVFRRGLFLSLRSDVTLSCPRLPCLIYEGCSREEEEEGPPHLLCEEGPVKPTGRAVCCPSSLRPPTKSGSHGRTAERRLNRWKSIGASPALVPPEIYRSRAWARSNRGYFQPPFLCVADLSCRCWPWLSKGFFTLLSEFGSITIRSSYGE